MDFGVPFEAVKEDALETATPTLAFRSRQCLGANQYLAFGLLCGGGLGAGNTEEPLSRCPFRRDAAVASEDFQRCLNIIQQRKYAELWRGKKRHFLLFISTDTDAFDRAFWNDLSFGIPS